MGRELSCEAVYRGNASTGKAHLDTDAITFRGGFRVNIPYREIESAEADNGLLLLRFRGESVSLKLGADSADWAERILNPPSLMKKLGVKSGMAVSVVGPVESDFIESLKREGAEVADSARVDMVFLRADEPEDLDRIPQAKERIQQDGSVWVITPRGRKELQDVVVMAAGKAAGLVDVKVCRFSETHTALKFVIPKAERVKR